MALFERERTPFYYYDMGLLRDTLEEINRLTAGKPIIVHYAVKANGNPRILNKIASYGLGADLVSGGEIFAALKAGFSTSKMVYAGVGKTDDEIRLGLECGIGCFNVESLQELEVINQIAEEKGKTAPIAIRVNPDIDAHTHRYITTATASNKFGICMEMLDDVIAMAESLPCVSLRGLHFHIGSQITKMQPYEMLCDTINKLIMHFAAHGIHFESINVGGGLGIDYASPKRRKMPQFEAFFDTFMRELHPEAGQKLHFELGRSVVAQCGTLVTRVLYVKESRNKKFVITDAGMTDLIRPALYEAHHRIQNISSARSAFDTYDVVGPICESSDVFAYDCQLPVTQRGDFLVIRSTGAYGESMASTYNMHPLPKSVFSDNK